MTAALFTYQVIDAGSRVVPGAKVSFMQGFRKGPVWHDPEMRTPARSPYITDGAGRVALYLKAGETYEITIETPRGDRVQFTHVARADGEVIRETETVEVPVERVVYQDSPETLRKLAEMEALLAAASAPKPEPVSAHIPPPEIADLVQFGETYEQTNARLLPLYREAQHMKEMAIENGDKTARVRWETKIRNIDTTMHWMHGRRIETI